MWHAAWTRLHRKMLALQEKKSGIARRHRARGEDNPDMSEWGAAMKPLAALSSTGNLVLDKDLTDKIRSLGRKK